MPRSCRHARANTVIPAQAGIYSRVEKTLSDTMDSRLRGNDNMGIAACMLQPLAQMAFHTVDISNHYKVMYLRSCT